MSGKLIDKVAHALANEKAKNEVLIRPTKQERQTNYI